MRPVLWNVRYSFNCLLRRLQDDVRDLQQDRLVLFDVQSDKNHVMRHAHQLQAILLPLRTALESEKSARESLKAIIDENSKWIQLYEVVGSLALQTGSFLRFFLFRWRSTH